MKDGPARRSGFRWTQVLLLLAVVILLALITVPNYLPARHDRADTACLVNLVCIDAAKQQWARANNKTNGMSLTPADIAGVLAYMKNSAMPVCPSGGVYTFGKVGEKPACSLAPGHGHAL